MLKFPQAIMLNALRSREKEQKNEVNETTEKKEEGKKTAKKSAYCP